MSVKISLVTFVLRLAFKMFTKRLCKVLKNANENKLGKLAKSSQYEMKIERDKHCNNVVNCSTHECGKRKTFVIANGIFIKPANNCVLIFNEKRYRSLIIVRELNILKSCMIFKLN